MIAGIGSPVAEPALKLASMDDAEDQDDVVVRDDVVYDSVVADAQSVEGVTRSLDRLDGLAPDPHWRRE